MKRLLQFGRVRTWLTFWFLVIALAPLITISIIIYIQRVKSIREEGFVKLQAIRDLKVHKLNNWLNERLADMKVLKEYSGIQGIEYIENEKELSSENIHNESTIRALMERYIENYNVYNELFILHPETGEILISTDQSNEGVIKIDDPYFTVPRQMEKVFIQDIYTSSTTYVPSMFFSIPISSSHNKERIVGILVTRVDLEHSLYDLLLSRTGLGETGETLIVNKDIVVLNELRWYEGAPLKLKIEAGPAVMAAHGEIGVIEVEDYRHEMVLAAYTHIPRTGWGFVVKQDLAEIFSPIDALLRNIMMLLMGAIIGALIIAVNLARTIAGPIQKMAEISTRLQEGDMNARNCLDRPDEIGLLAQSFDDMAESISSQMTIQRRGNDITNTMVAAIELSEFAQELLKILIETTDSTSGAFYVRDAKSEAFELLASFGADAGPAKSFNAKTNEGELVIAFAKKEITYINDIPENKKYSFKTIMGDAIPKEIITIPIVVEEQVQAAIVIANLKNYSAESKQILEQTWIGMNTAFGKLMSAEKVKQLAQDLNEKNEELQAKSDELQLYANTLKNHTTVLKDQRFNIQKSDRLKSEFLSNMSHELRTPLNSIMALSQLMLSRGTNKKKEQDEKYLRIIERNSKQLLSLINDILDLAKIESGQVEMQITDFNPQMLVKKALDSIRPIAEKIGLTVNMQLDDLETVRSDEDKVFQILLNLLSNAVKFTERGGIDIKMSESQGNVWFVVNDTGKGISRDALSYIFDEFRQVDGSLTRKYEGTGLGLAICKKLSKLLGGEITVQSTLGEGSAFTLSFPIQPPEFTPSVSVQTNALEDDPEPATVLEPKKNAAAWRKKRTGAKRNILVVEDQPDNMFTITEILKELDCKIVTANNGFNAVKAAKNNHPELILMDIQLPGLSGLDATKQIKAIPGLEETLIIAITARAMKGEREKILAAGCDDYISKPIHPEKLISTIKKWID